MSDKKAMTPEEFAERAREIVRDFGGDEEASHWRLDKLLCEALRGLGYGEGVKTFEDSDKWYA